MVGGSGQVVAEIGGRRTPARSSGKIAGTGLFADGSRVAPRLAGEELVGAEGGGGAGGGPVGIGAAGDIDLVGGGAGGRGPGEGDVGGGRLGGETGGEHAGEDGDDVGPVRGGSVADAEVGGGGESSQVGRAGVGEGVAGGGDPVGGRAGDEQFMEEDGGAATVRGHVFATENRAVGIGDGAGGGIGEDVGVIVAGVGADGGEVGGPGGRGPYAELATRETARTGGFDAEGDLGDGAGNGRGLDVGVGIGEVEISGVAGNREAGPDFQAAEGPLGAVDGHGVGRVAGDAVGDPALRRGKRVGEDKRDILPPAVGKTFGGGRGLHDVASGIDDGGRPREERGRGVDARGEGGRSCGAAAGAGTATGVGVELVAEEGPKLLGFGGVGQAPDADAAEALCLGVVVLEAEGFRVVVETLVGVGAGLVRVVRDGSVRVPFAAVVFGGGNGVGISYGGRVGGTGGLGAEVGGGGLPAAAVVGHRQHEVGGVGHLVEIVAGRVVHAAPGGCPLPLRRRIERRDGAGRGGTGVVVVVAHDDGVIDADLLVLADREIRVPVHRRQANRDFQVRRMRLRNEVAHERRQRLRRPRPGADGFEVDADAVAAAGRGFRDEIGDQLRAGRTVGEERMVACFPEERRRQQNLHAVRVGHFDDRIRVPPVDAGDGAGAPDLRREIRNMGEVGVIVRKIIPFLGPVGVPPENPRPGGYSPIPWAQNRLLRHRPEGPTPLRRRLPVRVLLHLQLVNRHESREIRRRREGEVRLRNVRHLERWRLTGDIAFIHNLRPRPQRRGQGEQGGKGQRTADNTDCIHAIHSTLARARRKAGKTVREIPARMSRMYVGMATRRRGGG